MSIFVTADWHLDHTNVIKYDKRPWSNVHIMNKDIIVNATEVVGKDDTLIYLGDLSFATRARYVEWLFLIKRLFPSLIFVHGNHDKGINSTVWEETGIIPLVTYHMDSIVFSHVPIFNLPENTVNIHGHTHKPSLDGKHVCVSICVTDYKPVKVI